MIDLMVYRAEGFTVRNGESLYDMVATSAHLPNTYPPFAALLFTPLTLLGVPAMRTLATAGNLAAARRRRPPLAAAGRPAPHGSPGPPRPSRSPRCWCGASRCGRRCATARSICCSPSLVLWDLTRRDTHRLAGIGIGIAAGLKLTPALFAVFLALAGAVRAGQLLRSGAGARAAWNPWLRQAAVATATFLATALLSALALPRDSYRFWTEIVFAADRVGEVEITANQSLRGALARLLHTHDPGAAWVVVAGLAGGPRSGARRPGRCCAGSAPGRPSPAPRPRCWSARSPGPTTGCGACRW